MNNSNAPHNIFKQLPSTYSTVIVGVGFFLTSASGLAQPGAANHRDRHPENGAGAVIASVGTDGARTSRSRTAAVSIASGTTVLAPNTWYYLEFKLVVGTSGSCELHLNGVPGEIPSTTGNFGATNIGALQLVCLAISDITDVSFDDLYILDTTGSSPQNNFLGDVVVETLFPNADGSHLDWIPNPAGTHFNKVNQTIPDGDTTYVSSINPGDIDTYTVGSLATLSGTVFGVCTNLYARKDDAAGRQVAPVIREAGTDHVGTTTGGLTTSYLYYRQLYQTDPAGAAWTIASVNGAEYGVKEVT